MNPAAIITIRGVCHIALAGITCAAVASAMHFTPDGWSWGVAAMTAILSLQTAN